MSGAPPRRAVLRWSWRLFRREWRQYALVLGLMVVAVTLAVGGSTMVASSTTAGRGKFGRAGALMHVDASDPTEAQATVVAARSRFGPVEVVGHQSVAVPGSPDPLDLRSQAPHGHFSAPTLGLRHGRYPQTDGEIALTPRVETRLGVRIGSTLTLGGVTRTVVGEVENSGDLHDDFGLLAASDTAHADSLTLFVTSATLHLGSPPPANAAPIAFRLEGAPLDKRSVDASVVAVATLSMALVALIAAAGFVVVAQRRQRQLGLLAAIGATERHIRLVTIANGVIVGVVASAIGGALGVLGWVVAAPALETAIGHRVDRWALPWGLIATCLALALAAATAAAWWPARMMARQPTMMALSRRPAKPSPVRRSIALAAVALAGGAALIVAAHPTGQTVSPLPLMGGLVAMILGVVLVAPAAIRVLALPAKRLPFASRLALRDLVRHQPRAAAALAAITLALGVSVTILALAQANKYKADEGNLSSRQMVIHVPSGDNGPDPLASDATRASNDKAAAAIAAAIPNAKLTPLDVAFNPTTVHDPNLREPIADVIPMPHGFRGIGVTAYVATPQLLAAAGIAPDALRPSSDLVTSSMDNVTLLDPSARVDSKTTVQRVAALGKYTSAPIALITPAAMTKQGWISVRSGWLVQSPKALTSAQLARAQKAAGQAELTVEARSSQDDLANLRMGATVVGVLVALAIVAMTMGLLRGESVADLRTLTATGAGGGVRRALTGATAGALAFVGVVLGMGGAYATLIAAYHAKLGQLVPLPVVNLVLLVVGLPILASAGGWLLAGREPVSFARQALD